MRLAHLIKKLDEMHDQVKYHGAIIPNVPDFLQGLSDELRSIGWDEVYEAKAIGAERGFNHARKLVDRLILKNATLKTRGEMIAALENLNGDEQTVLSEKEKVS